MKIERTGPLDWEGLQFAALVESQLNNEAMKQFEELIKAWYLVGWYGGVDGKLHHLSDIEKRFASLLGMSPGKIPSVALTPDEHQAFTKVWRQAIGYADDNASITTLNATWKDVLSTAQSIYSAYPELLKAIEDAFIQ